MAKFFTNEEITPEETAPEATTEAVVTEAVVTEEVVAEPEAVIVQEPVSMSDIIAAPRQEEIKEEVKEVVTPVYQKVVRFEIKNKLEQHLHLANGDILQGRSTMLVEKLTEQMLTLKQRGFISVKEV